MNEYALGILNESRVRIRLQIKARSSDSIRGHRDSIFFVKSYVINHRENGTFVLSYIDRNNNTQRIELKVGQYVETKLMG